jgi:hypothetical protein
MFILSLYWFYLIVEGYISGNCIEVEFCLKLIEFMAFAFNQITAVADSC